MSAAACRLTAAEISNWRVEVGKNKRNPPYACGRTLVTSGAEAGVDLRRAPMEFC